MATYTKQDNLYAGSPPNWFGWTTDGSIAFYYQAGASPYDFYEYIFSSGTNTVILQDSAVYNSWGVVWFNGDLYGVFSYDNAGTSEWVVAKWDGTYGGVPSDWTVVDVVHSGAPGPAWMTIQANSSEIVVTAWTNGSTPLTRYSSNGSSWSNGSYSGFTPIYETGGTAPLVSHFSGVRLPVHQFPTSAGYATSVMAQFASGVWSVIATNPSQYCRVDGIAEWWTWNWSGTAYAEKTTDFSAYQTPDSDIEAAGQIDMPQTFGFEVIGSDTKIYKFDTSWSLIDTIVGSQFYPGNRVYFIRDDNNDVWLVGRPSGAANTEIWKRSETLPDPVAEDYAEFWKGVRGDRLTKKSDLPWPVQTPGGLAINLKSLQALIGRGTTPNTGSDYFRTGESPDYGTWTEHNDGYTDGPVTGVEFINDDVT